MKFSARKLLLLITGLVVLGASAVYVSVPAVKWRADVILLKLGGQIDDIELGQLISMAKPGSGFWLQPLVETRSPYSSISNPFVSAEDVSAGDVLFQGHCSKCHGSGGVGNSAPALTRPTYTHGDSDWSLFRNISEGIGGTAMAQSSLNDREIWSLVAYLRTLKQSSAPVDASLDIDVPRVSSEMIPADSGAGKDWLTYSGSFNGQRFSELRQVTSGNASDVGVRWIHQFSGSDQMHETSPIVISGIMFVTEAPNIVHALEASTGELIWTYTYQNAPDLKLCCGAVNRGLAIYGDTVYLGTLDSHLVALDVKTGSPKWISDLHDHQLGTSVTAAPLAVEGKIIVGYGGGDLGIRGFVDAVDSSSGENEWRFYTIPAEGEPGNDTWSGDSWKTGGAATWLTGSYDNQTRLLFWAIGNPAPDYQGELRLGDNLYSNSVVALNIDTGELVWHFQFTPHDEHDWDSNQIPVLVDREWRGEQRRLLLLANRNAFFYVLDRDSGEFLLAEPFAKQNWATKIDAKGRPVLNPDTILTTEGKATWPSPIGATNWQSPTYSPVTGLLYVPTLEFGQIVFKDAEAIEYEVGESFLGGRHAVIPGDTSLFFAVRALDPETGKVVWEYMSEPRESWWKTGGLVSTRGNVIFGGDGTNVFILDAVTGDELWKKNVGGRINASPITYESDGVQYFVIAAGRSLIAIGLEQDEAGSLQH